MKISGFLKSHSTKKGYTLIELSVVLIIAGVSMAAFGKWYTVDYKRNQMADTESNISSVVNSIGNFRTMFGRYPCPASLTAKRGDAGYGHESSVCDGTHSYDSTNVGNMIDGLLYEQSNRDVTGAGDKPRIIRGTVPFRVLNLPEEVAYDGYGNRLYYVVTEPLATDGQFNHRYGGVSLLAKDGVTAIEPEASAHFLVYSSGENEEGGYAETGNQVKPCPTTYVTHNPPAPPVTVDRAENENCDTDGDGVYLVGSVRKGRKTADEFDDRGDYFASGDVPLWQFFDDLPRKDDVVNLTKNNIGIGHTSVPQAKVHVSGTVRAYDTLYADEICDNLENCFMIRQFAGDPDDSLTANSGMSCPDDEYMVAISESQPVCEKPENINIGCSAPYVLIGIAPDGSAICDKPPPGDCSAADVKICVGTSAEATKVLEASESSIIRRIDAGYSKWVKYRCYDGTWKKYSSGGLCECDPTDIETRKISCGTNFTGSKYQERNKDCSTGEWESWVTTDASECVCKEADTFKIVPCVEPLTGAGTYYEMFWTCSDTQTGSWGNWIKNDALSDCSCVSDTYQKNTECPAGFSGQIKETWTLDCNLLSWQLVSSEDQCTCVEKSQVKDFDCPDGQIGSRKMQRDFLCPAGVWTNYYDIAGGLCTAAPTVVCGWDSVGTATYGTESKGSLRGSNCECGTSNAACYDSLGYGKYNNYSECVCK